MVSPGKIRAGGHALTYTSRNRGAVLSCIIERCVPPTISCNDVLSDDGSAA